MKNRTRIPLPLLGLALLGGIALWTALGRRTGAPVPDQPPTAAATAPTPAAPAAAPSGAISGHPAPLNPATPPRSDIWTRLAPAKVLETRDRPTTDGKIIRTSRLDYPGKYSQLLVRETLFPAAGNRTTVVAQVAMVADHLLVQRAQGVSPAEFESALAQAGMKILAPLSSEGLYRVSFDAAGMDALDQALARLALTKPVAFAEPDYLVSASDIENRRQVVVPGPGGAMIDPVAAQAVTPGSFSDSSAPAPNPDFVRQDRQRRLDFLPAGTRLLTFDAPSFPYGAGAYIPYLEEQNFRVSQNGTAVSDRYVYVQHAVSAGSPNNGTLYARTFGNQFDFTVRHTESVAFTAVSIDLAEYSTSLAVPKSVTFTGHKAGGGTVSQTFVTDGVIDGTGPVADFQTFTFNASFTGLTQLVANTTGYMIDNIGVLIDDSAESPPVPPPAPPVVYQVTWDAPKHTPDQVAAVAGPFAPSAINFGTPRVRSSVGTMTGPALEFAGGTGDGSFGSGYQQIQFNLGRNAQLYRMEFDLYLDQPDEFRLIVDSTSGTVVSGVWFHAGSFPDKTVFQVRFDIDMITRATRLYLNGVDQGSSGSIPASVDIRDIRLHLTGANAVSRVGVDNLVITASGTIATPATGPVLAGASTFTYLGTPVGALTRSTYELRNDGGQNLSVTSISSDNPTFRVVESYPIQILPNGTYPAKVDFHPLTIGTHTGTLTISSNDPNLPVKTVAVTGSALAAPKVSLTPPTVALTLAAGATAAPSVTVSNVGVGTLYWSLVPDYARPAPGPAPHAPVTPSDSFYYLLYGLKDPGLTGAGIDATHAWAITTGVAAVKVAVIDSGVDSTHPDLAANVDTANGWNFITNTSNAMDDNGHGTHVAGTIAALGNNSLGVTGVSWGCKIVALKFLDTNGNGFTSDAVDAVNYAAARNIRITNNSWGGGGFSQSLHDAILASGALFVASAGNAGTDNDIYYSYPAGFDCGNILSVAATDSTDTLASFSQYGATSVDLAAPGVSIASTYPGNQYAFMSGTSMAAPHVSGAAALLLSHDPAINPQELKQLLMTGTDPRPGLTGKMLSGGRLNIYTSLRTTYSSWITAPVSSGSVSGGLSQTVSLAVDSLGLTPATYTQNFFLDSNDLLNSRLLLPVTLAVTATTTQLTVTLAPATGQWRVDGGAWQASGATVSGLSAGSHTVEYNSLAGYTAPVTETVSLTAGQSLSLSRSYTAVTATAHFTLNLTPANGKWRLDGGAWNPSGYYLYYINTGPHLIEYIFVNGYAAPASETVTLVSGTNSFDRAYTPLAHLSVTLTPTTGRWRMDGGTWKTSGAYLYNIPTGSHLLEYYDQAGLTSLPAETVTLTAGVNSLSRTLVAAGSTAQLSVTLTPGTGQWRVDGGAWQASAATVTGLAAGNHTVEYNTLAGYTAPATETVSLSAGQSLTFSRSYIALPAQLSVTLTPGSGQWRVDGGAWQASAATVTGLAAGNHTVEYNTLAGYTAPATETVTLAAGQTLSFSRSYTVLPAQLTISLTPGTGRWRVDGGAWQASGATLAVPPGIRSITYEVIPNYASPAPESVTLAGGAIVSYLRSYLPYLVQDYVATDLGVVGLSSTYARAVNIHGHVVGSLAGSGPTRAFVYRDGSLEALTLPIGVTDDSSATDINDGDVIVGAIKDASGASRAFRYENGVMDDLGTVGSDTFARATAINNAGTIVGYSSPGVFTPPAKAFKIEGGTMQLLGTLGGTESWAYGLNDAGSIVGGARIPPGAGLTHAALFEGGTVQDLGALFQSADAYAINTAGVVVGTSYTASGYDHAFRYAAGSMQDLGVLDGIESDAYAINAAGTIVGSIKRADAQDYAMITFTNGAMADVNTLVVLPGITLDRANDINDLGQIAATANNGHSYLLTPQDSPGGLQLTLAPAAGQWRVDGGAWQASGAIVLNLTEGPHSVEYSGLADYTTPPTETVAVPSGRLLQLSRSYAVAPSAQLSITLAPSSGQWRVDGGAWQASAATVTGLAAGNHTVEYNTLAGYTAPATETVALTAGQSLSFSRSYTALPAQLSVTLTPGTGQWRVNGGAWQASAATVTGLAAGNHTVEYNSLAGYTAPATETVALTAGQSLSLSRSYTALPASAQLTVILTPASGQWRVDGGAWQASGATVTGIAPGSHTIDYNSLAGYTAPATETVTLTAGQSLSLSRSYAAITATAHFSVTLTPANGKWRLDGGAWNSSGFPLYFINTGSHVIEYFFVNGYAAPATETVTLVSGSNSLDRAYTALAHLTVTLTPATGRWRMDGGTWQTSGAYLYNIPTGSHLLEFYDQAGATSLPAETVTLTSGVNSLPRTLLPP